MVIERKIVRTGRWKAYEFVVNGVALGTIRRTITGGGDNMAKEVRRAAWTADFGLITDTAERLEATMIQRAVRFGTIRE